MRIVCGLLFLAIATACSCSAPVFPSCKVVAVTASPSVLDAGQPVTSTLIFDAPIFADASAFARTQFFTWTPNANEQFFEAYTVTKDTDLGFLADAGIEPGVIAHVVGPSQLDLDFLNPLLPANGEVELKIDIPRKSDAVLDTHPPGPAADPPNDCDAYSKTTLQVR